MLTCYCHDGHDAQCGLEARVLLSPEAMAPAAAVYVRFDSFFALCYTHTRLNTLDVQRASAVTA
jgi:hypothetical protein